MIDPRKAKSKVMIGLLLIAMAALSHSQAAGVVQPTSNLLVKLIEIFPQSEGFSSSLGLLRL